MALTNEIRSNYERYFPVTEFFGELRTVFNSILPDASWIPLVLKNRACRSLPDFWKQLPAHLAGKVTWEHGELLPLACALASPRKNGCHAGRYPEQLAYLREWVTTKKRVSIDTIDYACSTGQGTYDVAGLLDHYVEHGRAIGVTREPLEAWMARNRCLPHLEGCDGPLLQYSFPPPSQKLQVSFVAGDIRESCIRGMVDLIVCNGLIGGPNQDNDTQFVTLWRMVESQLKPGGILMVGNRFHDGFKQKETRFLNSQPPTMQLAYDSDHTSVLLRK